jgi:hypothetical protein
MGEEKVNLKVNFIKCRDAEFAEAARGALA